MLHLHVAGVVLFIIVGVRVFVCMLFVGGFIVHIETEAAILAPERSDRLYTPVQVCFYIGWAKMNDDGFINVNLYVAQFTFLLHFVVFSFLFLFPSSPRSSRSSFDKNDENSGSFSI